MSTEYKDTESVPNNVISERLDKISDAISAGGEHLLRETTMRVPAECDRDADLVLAEAAKRLKDQRLSSDPLTALAAVMREHDLGIYAGDAIINIKRSDSVLFSSSDMSHYCVTADDIKPKSSND